MKDYGLHRRVLFLGTVENAALPEAYKNADLLVFLSRFEGNLAVVMESMTSGTPVVSLDTTPGANEVILHGQNGLLSSPVYLARDVRGLVRDRSRLNQMAKPGRQRIIQEYNLFCPFEAHRNFCANIVVDGRRS